MKGNLFASVVFFTWPFIVIYLFRTKPLHIATLVSIIGGEMFLPVGYVIDIPLLPPIDKNSITVITITLYFFLFLKKNFFNYKHDPYIKYILCILLIGPAITIYNNQEPIFFTSNILPGLAFRDLLSVLVGKLLFFTPFFIGAYVFRTHKQHIDLYRFVAIAGLIYSLLVLIEVRLSPQLHNWIYGYSSGGFAQQKRDGGFRATVFMGHGLWVAFFIFITLSSSSVLARLKQTFHKVSFSKVSIYLFFVLFLSKSLASLIYGLSAFILFKYCSPKWLTRYALLLAFIALSYPLLSITNLFPHQSLIDVAEVINHERAGSLEFRFKNEQVLLEKAQEKLFSGWGGWGRNRVYDSSGKDLTITDGRWIITLGGYGIIGFILEFGLLAMTIRMASRAILNKTIDYDEKFMIAASAFIIGVLMIDQIPNASLKPWIWLFVGALYGRVRYIKNSVVVDK